MRQYSKDITFYEGGRTQVVKGWTPICYGFRIWELADRADDFAEFHTNFLNHLSMLRLTFGKPLNVSSCCRTPQHNEDVGGHIRSLHLTVNPVHETTGSMAIDFNVSGWSNDEIDQLIIVGRKLGWSIGHGYEMSGYGGAYSSAEARSFIHMDRRIDIGLKQTDFYY